MRALASDPNDRYPSALALMRDIESFAQDARVSLSSVEITEFLRELFGDQPLPTFDEAEDASPTALHPDSRSAVRPIDRAAAATAELPAQTGISLVRGDKPTSVLREDSRGMVIGQGAAAPDHKTRVASGDVTPSRISTDIIDKTMRFEAPDRTVVANSAVVTERNTVAVATERNRAATLPQGTSGGHPILPTDTPSSPVPVSTLLPPIDEPLHVRPSSWIAVIAASLAGLIGIAVVASGDDDEPPPAASVEPEPVPAAAVPDATATISSPPPISSPVGTAPGPAPDPTPTVAPDSPGETAGADVVIEDDDTEGTTALDEDEGGDASTETPSRRSKSSGKRRGRSKSGTPKKKKSGGGLDSMYPGGGP
jgi:hypothetical protein